MQDGTDDPEDGVIVRMVEFGRIVMPVGSLVAGDVLMDLKDVVIRILVGMRRRDDLPNRQAAHEEPRSKPPRRFHGSGIIAVAPRSVKLLTD